MHGRDQHRSFEHFSTDAFASAPVDPRDRSADERIAENQNVIVGPIELQRAA